LPAAAYDVRMGKSGGSGLRVGRRALWLALGTLTGLGIGFVYGLMKPRARA